MEKPTFVLGDYETRPKRGFRLGKLAKHPALTIVVSAATIAGPPLAIVLFILPHPNPNIVSSTNVFKVEVPASTPQAQLQKADVKTVSSSEVSKLELASARSTGGRGVSGASASDGDSLKNQALSLPNPLAQWKAKPLLETMEYNVPISVDSDPANQMETRIAGDVAEKLRQAGFNVVAGQGAIVVSFKDIEARGPKIGGTQSYPIALTAQASWYNGEGLTERPIAHSDTGADYSRQRVITEDQVASDTTEMVKMLWRRQR